MPGRLAQYPEYSEETENILPSEYHLSPGVVVAYTLGNKDNYCKNIINPQTNTIDQNYYDTTSAIISQEFGKVYQLYTRLKKNKYSRSS